MSQTKRKPGEVAPSAELGSQYPAKETKMNDYCNNIEVLKNPVMSRRKALGLMAVVSVAPTTVVGGVLASPVFTTSHLQTLFDKHSEAWRADCNAWDALAVFADDPALSDTWIEHVEVATLVGAADQNGVSTRTPIYKGSKEAIEAYYLNRLRLRVDFNSSTATDRERQSVERCQARIAEKCAELDAIKASNKKIHDDAGYTAALAAAQASSDHVKAIEAQILSYAPYNMAEVRAQARWISQVYADHEYSYLHERTDVLETLLATLSKAAEVTV
ncbi:hypothetical protein IFT84_13530 [Rhizobium sp. CFBP 8762]|uniref:hypothetical protein n=1 Tax=Rhizobium sp. CFBP 8762 TaxID=2775279 RepID=UPI00177F6AAF|nr:hypothetical protein [Rhizobium sp. CFBP 8762]MBD8555528.1 hypothetical protein [Rhizobium sp. CFBP 8762]